MNSRVALIMAGGTGGHIYPGLALAETLTAAGYSIHWQGTPGGMEHKLVARTGYPMHTVEMTGVRGKGVTKWLALPFRLAKACWQARGVLARVKPNLVIGIGGYMSVPGGLMACFTRRPLVILEPGAVAGIANRLLALFAERVLVGFPHSFSAHIDSRVARMIPTTKNVEWCGVPLRASITDLPAPQERFAGREGPIRVLIVGGSLGAQTMNELLVAAIGALAPNARPEVTHQSGEAHFEALKAAYEKAGVRAEVVAFIHDMAARYRDCDVLICRAGAITVAEIAAAGVAAVLIPLPWYVGDEQRANARFLVDAGAGLMIDQREATPASISALLATMTREKLLAMATAARELGKRDASATAARICMEAAKV
jgi:UDP-N-acetylglucosamine--N-acetylmuramyl-(pentapeptide) pyrophosphoryl-undecaprenol N-acetylglucosamine transferase